MTGRNDPSWVVTILIRLTKRQPISGRETIRYKSWTNVWVRNHDGSWQSVMGRQVTNKHAPCRTQAFRACLITVPECCFFFSSLLFFFFLLLLLNQNQIPCQTFLWQYCSSPNLQVKAQLYLISIWVRSTRSIWYVCRLWDDTLPHRRQTYHIDLVDLTHIQRTRPRRKTVFFKTSFRVYLISTYLFPLYSFCYFSLLSVSFFSFLLKCRKPFCFCLV